MGQTKIPADSAANRWEHFSHLADVGVRGYGDTLEESFAQAALAMTAVVTDLSLVNPEQEVAVSCEAPDEELLLTDWLNALIFEMSTRSMLFCRFEVHINESRLLSARAWGEKIDIARHRPSVEVKGATYTALKVEHLPDGGWLAQCVVDV